MLATRLRIPVFATTIAAMRITFDVTSDDVERARRFFDAQSGNAFVAKRRERNVEGKHGAVTQDSFWKALVDCLLTTQQRSGPDSPVARFVRSEPYPLTLAICRSAPDVVALVSRALREHGGIRRHDTIATQIGGNLRLLDEGAWDETFGAAKNVERDHTASDERLVAHALADALHGIGPKQSRNLLQMLGLTQHEIPIDSRIAKWLRNFGFPLAPSATGLADHAYYDLMSDGFQALCAAADITPCLLDAAIDRSPYEPYPGW